MIRKSLLLLSVLMIAATLLYAQKVTNPDEKKAAKITGFVVDRQMRYRPRCERQRTPGFLRPDARMC